MMKQLRATTMSLPALLLLASVATAQEQGQQASPQVPREPIVKGFEELDKDGDGYIDEQEADDENVWYHFDAIDKNNNDVLSREEFVDYIAERPERATLGEELPPEELPQAHLRERYTQDTDVVTNPELLPKISSDFDSVDDDGDSFLTREEADSDHIHEHFSHMDKNSDGRVSATEYSQYLYEYGTQVAEKDLVEEVVDQQ